MSFFEAADPVFSTYVLGNAPLKQLASGFDWVEGPVWFGDANCLLFSDIPNNRIMRWSPDTGISIYREPANYTNGHTRDLQGRLISCEHGSRRVTRTEHDGTITVIADRFEGKRLNSPNDVVVKSDGSIWFSDPHYGIMTNYEGHKSEQEIPCQVYCVDPNTGEMKAVVTEEALNQVRKLAKVAQDLDCSLACLSLAWCLKNPNVSSVITGASSLAQIKENMEAAEFKEKMTDDVMHAIETVLSTD